METSLDSLARNYSHFTHSLSRNNVIYYDESKRFNFNFITLNNYSMRVYELCINQSSLALLPRSVQFSDSIIETLCMKCFLETSLVHNHLFLIESWSIDKNFTYYARSYFFFAWSLLPNVLFLILNPMEFNYNFIFCILLRTSLASLVCS